MSRAVARGFRVLVSLGLFGSAAAGVATARLGWAVAPFVAVSALLGILWGLAFLRGTLPVREPSPELRERLERMTEQASAQAGIPTPRALVSARAVNATVSICNGRAQMVFPRLWVERLTDAQLHACVAHELAHVGQPDMRRVSGSWASIIASWNLGISVVALNWLVAPGGFDAHSPGLVFYALVPLLLTATVVLRRLVHLRSLMALEHDADRQAVSWGVSPRILSTTLDELVTPAFTVPQPFDQRLLRALIALNWLSRSLLAERTDRLRALDAGI